VDETTGENPPLGRRERNKLEKLTRIHRAAAELIDAHGIAAVTTQQVAEQADVAAGTLFQYVASKSELLLMVLNQRFAEAVAVGWADQGGEVGLRPRLTALLQPVVACNRQQTENGRAYLLEVAFGDPAERHRAEATAIVDELTSHVEQVLIDTGAASADDAHDSARVVFAVFYYALSDTAGARSEPASVMADIDRQLATHFPEWT